jgi:hypothetical protein
MDNAILSLILCAEGCERCIDRRLRVTGVAPRHDLFLSPQLALGSTQLCKGHFGAVDAQHGQRAVRTCRTRHVGVMHMHFI